MSNHLFLTETSTAFANGSDGTQTARRKTVRIILAIVSALSMPPLILAMIPTPDPPALLTVEKLPFRFEVSSIGTIDPLKTVRVCSESLWKVQVLSLLPEGTFVQRGDVVCELDSSEIREVLREREVLVIKAKAALEAARRQEELMVTGNERRLEAAERAVQAAELDLQLYEEATFPQQIARLQQDIGLTDNRLSLTDEEYQTTLQLWTMGIENSPALAMASLQVTKEQEELRRLEGDQALIRNFRHPRTMTELDHQRRMSQLNLLRTELSNSLKQAKSRIGTLTDQRRLGIYERYVYQAQKSIEACTLRAPCDGFVIYSNSGRRSRGYDSVEVGGIVHLNQPIFEVPESDRLKISVPMHETLITRIWLGMPVTVRATGFEDQEIAATVSKISPYPVRRSRYQPGEKDFWLDLTLNPTEEQRKFLHLRMDATATFALSENEQAIAVPREAMTRVHDRNVVLIAQGNRLLPCPVQPGEMVDGKVMIEAGLQEGDQIVAAISERQRDQLHAAMTSMTDAGD